MRVPNQPSKPDQSNTPDDAAADLHSGHRERLRRRFLSGGADAVADYELLELLLFSSRPRSDVKPLAKQLISRFGNFAAVISADPAELSAVSGMGEVSIVALKTAQAAALRLIGQPLIKRPVLSSWDQLVDYCRAAMGHSRVEEVRVLYLDRRNRLIADEVQQRGTVDQAPIYPRELVHRALQIGSSAVILVHNHPSGEPTPSAADIEMTRQVHHALSALGIALHDHLIVTSSKHVSFKQLGLL